MHDSSHDSYYFKSQKYNLLQSLLVCFTESNTIIFRLGQVVCRISGNSSCIVIALHERVSACLSRGVCEGITDDSRKIFVLPVAGYGLKTVCPSKRGEVGLV